MSPGPINTPLYGKLGLSNQDLAATASFIQGMVPLGRFGHPDEIARIVVFFASADSTFVVGGELIADGGLGL